MGLIVPFVVLFSFITFLTWFVRYFRLRQVLDKIPGPREYFFVGNMHMLKPGADAFFEQANAICEVWTTPRMTRLWMLWKPYLLVYGADECEVILSSNRHINKSREYKLLEPWMGLGLLTSYAEKWRPRRKLLTPTFHYEILKDFVDVYNQQAKVLVRKLETKAGHGPFDVYPFITLCALDVICESAMGRHVNAQQNKNSEYVKAIYRLNQIIHERQKAPWFWPDMIFNTLGRGKEHQKCLDIIHGFTYKVVKERRLMRSEDKANGAQSSQLKEESNTKGKRRQAFLDLLIDMENKNELAFQDICDEVNTFMFEGHDTTSAGMNWTLQLLGLHPDIQAKVHEELDQVLGDDCRDITFDDLKHLTYLECCIKESLRLYPSVPMFARKLEDDANFVGYRVPRGCVCLMFPYAVHRDPKHWPEPEKFDPDRFLPDNSYRRHPFAYLPFSAGARNCIGQRFALMEEKTVLAWILRFFSVKAIHRRDQLRLKGELILRPNVGVHLEFNVRQKIDFENPTY